MAIATSYGAMRAHERELSPGMIKAIDVCPRLGGVAGFTAEGSSIGAFPGHTLVEFALMRILVAGGAGPIFEMERKNFVVRPGAPLWQSAQGTATCAPTRGNCVFCVW